MKTVLLLGLICFVIIITGCKNDDNLVNPEKLIGVWVSTDLSDTLDFVDKENFYRSNAGMLREHYDYKIANDSISLRYSGSNYIFVLFTSHVYFVDGDQLTLDFSRKECYSFDKSILYFTRQ